MSTALLGRHHRTPDVARRLGVGHETVYRIARRWYPGRGHGNPITLTHADVRAVRAVLAITGRTGSVGTDQRLIEVAVTAIRYGPSRRWLYLTRTTARFHDTAEEAALAWATDPEREPGVVPWVIDLDPESEAA